MSEAPKKPPAIVGALLALGPISGAEVEYRQTGTGTAETYVHLSGFRFDDEAPKKLTIPGNQARNLLNFGVGFNYIAEIKPEFKSDWEAREKYEKSNAKELAEYKRLKRKFEP